MPPSAGADSPVKSKERVIRRALYLLLACILIESSAIAQPATSPAPANSTVVKKSTIVIDSDQKYLRLPENQRVKLLIRLIRTGKHQLAARLLASYPFTGPHGHNRNRFIAGMIDKANGNPAEAATKFRAVLADDPNLSLVRMELAHALYMSEQDDGARHHLELLKASAPTVDTSKQFDRFIDAIDARDPWAFDAYVSIAPSTNFNNGTSEEIVFINGLPFRISANSVEKSGIGVRGGANGSYTLRTGKNLSFIASAGINFTEYDGNTFDDLIFSESISAQKRTARGTVTGSLIATQRYSGTDEFSWTLGPQITWRQQLAAKVGLQSKLRFSYIDYKIADYRSGHKSTAEHRLSYSFADGTIGYLIAGGERSVTKQKFNDYWAAFGGLGVYHEAPYGITLYAEAEARRQWHEGIYPIINRSRKDTRIDVDVSLGKRDFEIMGLTPRIHYSYIRNLSNSPIDRYETHGANLTLTRRF